MNCFIWIILLLACGGNCGFRDCDCMTWDRCRMEERRGRRRDCDCEDMDSRRRRRDCDCEDMDSRRRDKDNDCDCDMRNRNRDRDMRDRCECENSASSYETFGCQENGIPCPPPVPTCSMR